MSAYLVAMHTNDGNQKKYLPMIKQIEDESKVDEWRKELGLEPLADYLAKNNIKYQPKQK